MKMGNGNGKKKRRGTTEIQLDVIYALAKKQLTQTEIANRIGISPSRLSHIKKERDDVAQAIEKGYNDGRGVLREKIYDMAASGDKTMLIWASKQWLGMSDREDHRVQTTSTVTIDVKGLEGMSYQERLRVWDEKVAARN